MNPEKEIRDQQNFEQGAFTQEDEKLYALLMDELSKEPALDIKPSFSADMLKRLEAKKKRESFWEICLFGTAIAGVFLLVLLGASFVKQAIKTSPDLLQNSPLAPALLFAGMLIIFQFIDKRYLKQSRLKRYLRED